MDSIYRIEDISFRYPRGDRKVLDGVSLSLFPGQVLCILGPNGAGKSTLLNCMAGLLSPQAGEIALLGRGIESYKRGAMARIVAYVQQVHVPAFAHSVFEFVLTGRAPYVPLFGRPGEEDRRKVWQVLDELNMLALADKAYTEISGGERQQCLIARAIVQEPQVILFDEPTANLDAGNQVRVLRFIRKMAAEGYAVVMTTHNPDHALLLDDQVAVMSNDGKLQAGNADRILNEENLQNLYNAGIRLIQIPELGRRAALYENL